jgi:hypothetical protein
MPLYALNPFDPLFKPIVHNLVQNHLFLKLTKLNIYKPTFKITVTAAAAVQKKET